MNPGFSITLLDEVIKLNEIITKSGVLLTDLRNFSMEDIIKSGQCFRWRKIGTNSYEGVAFSRYLRVEQNSDENTALFRCSQSDFDAFWYKYFDLGQDYQEIIDMIPQSDKFLTSAAKYCSGIRILRQCPWECLISFIISQQNNIPRIMQIIDKMCEIMGDKLYTPDGKIYYTFPSPQQIIDKYHLLPSLGLGYRDKYVIAAAIKVSDQLYDLNHLAHLDNESCIAELKKFYGVGDKVANCISLFGFHHTNAFPIDVWIKRVIDEVYNGEFNPQDYAPYAGIIQQYMFHYYRSIHK